MHLYVLVAAPFVAELIGCHRHAERSRRLVQLVDPGGVPGRLGLGGGFFGRIGDRIGRSRALCLTILTYALFTGLAFFAQTWWQLLIVRFLAALGIGGEWAVGASLLSETWPRRWRPWIAAVLQSGVNVGILLASCRDVRAGGQQSPRRSSWSACCRPCSCSGSAARSPRPTNGARPSARRRMPRPGIADLFRGEVRRTAVLVDPGLLGEPDGALGLHVLVSATPAEPAGRDRPAGRPEERARQHRQLPGDGRRRSSATSSRRPWRE